MAENGIIGCLVDLYKSKSFAGITQGWFLNGIKVPLDIIIFGGLSKLWTLLPFSFVNNRYLRGMVCGVLAPVISYPLDTAFVRKLQSNVTQAELVPKIIEEEGYTGFYKGIHFEILGRIVNNLLSFSVVPRLSPIIDSVDGAGNKIAVQFAMQLALSAISYPISTLKRRNQGEALWVQESLKPQKNIGVFSLWDGMFVHNFILVTHQALGNVMRGAILSFLLSIGGAPRTYKN